MQHRLICVAATLIVVAGTAGCGEETQPEQAKTARITVGGTTQATREVSCTQVDWSMTIETKSGPTRTHSLLQIGGEKPIAKTVDIAASPDQIRGRHGQIALERLCRPARRFAGNRIGR